MGLYDDAVIRSQAVGGAFTFATLPTAAQMVGNAQGIFAYTTDEGPCYWNGLAWQAIGSGGSGGLFSVTASPGTGPLDNYAPTGYVGGTTNRLLLTPASGGSTIDGILATGVPDGFSILIVNQSTTDVLLFPHLAAGSAAANRFSNANAGTIQVSALASARINYVVNVWKFS